MCLKRLLVLVGTQWSCGGLFEGQKRFLKEEARKVKAVDCFDWCEDWSLELEEVFSLEREGEFDKNAPLAWFSVD
ncbi:hypothetical protein Patl1_18725 [Pistacia atlantica]|uniref:Uncharacterized protein n=1 Tax=Pistacia atlantica TaxID=434234 RepID=A0ACC1BXT6_9ROSI|nr:hypothetical protein Patl1_18725 [Pistacia atlantica]